MWPQGVDIPQYMADAMAFIQDRDPVKRNKLFFDSWQVLGYCGGKYFPISHVNTAMPFTAFHFDFTDQKALLSSIIHHVEQMKIDGADLNKIYPFLIALAMRVMTLITSTK